MTGFLAAAAALVAVALAILLPPLLRRRAPQAEASRAAANAAIYRDQLAELEHDLAEGSLSQADFDQGRRELQRRLLEDAGAEGPGAAAKVSAKRSALLVGVALPIAAALAYFTLGNPAALSPETVAPPKVTAQQINDMVAKLAARLEQNPDDPKGWLMLARSYKALGRFDEAGKAFGKAGGLVDEDPQLLSDYADALAMAAGGSLRGKPGELVERALKLDADHLQALWLAGSAAFEQEDFTLAVRHWERALKQLPADSEDAQALAGAIEQARTAASQRNQKSRKPAAGK